MTQGKSIRLFLMDGDAGGRVKCTLANWTGIAYKIPRTELGSCDDREDLKQSGVYFLFGVSDQTGDPVVYIGQAGARKNGEGILSRLQEHKRNPDKDYWTEAVVFTTSNNFFGPTEISYLENRFCNMALSAKRYEVKNSNEPTCGNVTEETQSELEEFLEYAKLVMGTLGYKVFIPFAERGPASADASTAPDAEKSPDTCFFLSRTIRKYGITVKAQAKQTQEGFVVLAGSKIAPADNGTISPGIRTKRNSARVDGDGILQEDVLFSSPSGAAAFVTGQSVNGWTAWKTSDGRNLHELEQQEYGKAPTASTGP